MQSEVADELFKSQYEEGIRALQGARKASVPHIKKKKSLSIFSTGKSHQICWPIPLELAQECSLQGIHFS